MGSICEPALPVWPFRAANELPSALRGTCDQEECRDVGNDTPTRKQLGSTCGQGKMIVSELPGPVSLPNQDDGMHRNRDAFK